MKGKAPRKFKRYLTEPDDFKGENRQKYGQLTLKELKLHVSNMDMDALPSSGAPHAPLQRPHPLPPTHNRPLHQRNVLKRLPELTNTPQFNNGNEQTRAIPNPTLFRVSNPLFVVNTLFQILHEDTPATEENNKPKLELPPERRKPVSNEFLEVAAKSVKVPRPPRLLDHEFTRLTLQTAFSRRKIYSEEKARPKEKDQ